MSRPNRFRLDDGTTNGWRVAGSIAMIMQPAFPFVDISTPVELLSTMITPENPAVLIRDFKTDKTFIITRSDVIRVLTQVRGERGAAAR